MLKYIIKKSLLLLISLLIFSGAVSNGYFYYDSDNYNSDYHYYINDDNKYIDYYNIDNRYNNYNRYKNDNKINYKRECNSGTYGGFYHPRLRDGSMYKTDKDITGGTKYVTLVCKEGSISMIRTKIECDEGYYRSGTYCKRDRNYYRDNYYGDYNYYRDNYSNIRKYGDYYRGCRSGTYSSYYYPNLRDGQEYNSGKSVTGGTRYVTLVCRDGKISLIRSNIKCKVGYYRTGNYCKIRYNDHNYYY